MLIKQKSPLIPKNLAIGTFGELLIVFQKYAIPPPFNDPEVLSSACDKAKLFVENFLKILILMTQVPLYLFSLLELI